MTAHFRDKMTTICAAALMVLVMILVSSCSPFSMHLDPGEAEEPAAAKLPSADRILIAAVGDIMGHMPQLQSAWDPKSKTYNFWPSFEVISPHLSAADLTIANLETVLDDSRPYHGYPRFNSPSSLALALKEAGVDMVTTANNHALDQGEGGLLNSLHNLRNAGLLSTGTFGSDEDRQPLIVERSGFCIGCLAYTTTTNGLPVPTGKDYLVNLWTAETARHDIATAKGSGADFIIVSIHAGEEYQRYPSAAQEQIVADLLQAGADLILGCHPHVLQPWAEHIKPGTDQRALIIYSLGNFFSNQYFPYTDQGMILQVTLVRDPLSGIIDIEQYKVIPTRVLRAEGHTIVVDDTPQFPWEQTVLAMPWMK